jgi:3-oxoacyl-[acyl-carrier protein] reductase
VRSAFSPVDILVNNAGDMTYSPVEGMSDRMREESILVNLTAVFRCARARIPAMREKSGEGSSTSPHGRNTPARRTTLITPPQKRALSALPARSPKELGPYGVTVDAVYPGRILTGMLSIRMKGRTEECLRQNPLGRFGGPEEAADAVLFIASEGARHITGANLHVNGGLVMG